MKIFKAIVERDRDGSLSKEPGRTSVEIERLEYYYAARRIEEVWVYTEFMRLDPALTFVGIFESVPAIHIIERAPPE